MHRLSFLVFILLFSFPSFADTIRVAVASNFHSALNDLVGEFQNQTGHRVFVTSGSSGQLASQIVQGAPFDLFLSADIERVDFLQQKGIGLPDTRMTYALGKLVIVSNKDEPLDTFKRGNFDRIAFANPDLAPYGRAAKEVFDFFEVKTSRKAQVTANNVAQAFHYWRTGNVDIALVGMAQVIDLSLAAEMYAEVPQEAYSRIEQQMLVLSDVDAVHDFFGFLQSDQAAIIIRDRGYLVP